MATAVNSPIAQGTLIHVFHELPRPREKVCEICGIDPAVYRWTDQRNGEASNEQDSMICRVCASMILLVGKAK